jgi:dTDP-4-dehydrorhamnose reductase
VYGQDSDGVGNMKNILITGASGLLGYNLCRDLQNYYKIFAVRHRTQPPDTVSGIVDIDLGGSLKLLNTWIEQNNIHAIIHCAALSKPALCAADPDRASLLNVAASRDLASIAKQQGLRFLFTSTDLVYNSGEGPHHESDADPRILYSETKFDAEMEIFLVCPQAVVLRCALIFGADNGVHGSFLRDNDRDLQEGRYLKLFTDQYRSPVWSRDIADAIHRILSLGIRSQVYNIGGSTRLSRYELGMKAAEIFGWDSGRIIPVQMQGMIPDAAYLKDCSMNSSRLQTDTGWKPAALPDALTKVAGEWSIHH